MADEQVSEASGTDHERIGHIEQVQAEQNSKLDTLIDTVNKLIPGSHAEAEKRTESRLDRGSSMEEAARAEVQRALKDQEEQKKREEDEASHRAAHDAMVQLQEKPPAPPRSRKTAALGWGDGR